MTVTISPSSGCLGRQILTGSGATDGREPSCIVSWDYKAANWTHIGTTRGRGRYDRKNECALAKKDIWVQPLRRDWKRRLND